MDKKQIYLDNAATSKIKPTLVREAMINYYDNIGCSPGRGGYQQSLDAGRILLEARMSFCELFNFDKPENVIFTHNITYAINMILKGMLKEGDHVITTMMEHNAIVRPLNQMINKNKIEVDFVKANEKGEVNLIDIENSIKKNTRLIITTHASNVTGTMLPIKEIGDLAKKENIIYMVDSAQTAGSVEIDLKELNIDILAFTGHKGLYGPTGTGGFIIKSPVENQIDSFIQGGTGSISDKDIQPDFLPDKFECGTTNTIGIAGLKAGVDFILEIGIDKIHEKKMKLTKRLIDGFLKNDRIQIKGVIDIEKRVSTVSIYIENYDLGMLSFELDEQYGIMTRSGLHCAPYAHKIIGTYPEGTLRFSVGYFNTEEDIDNTIDALNEILK
ncbi:aminotransferase class V-fold PLP-dependent enzyme [Clostridiaceae bacterium HSG29]|nr:aminotransferase class V-fold PLP-dependent enzyme [Clostridiaceae bacterium HSG29]